MNDSMADVEGLIDDVDGSSAGADASHGHAGIDIDIDIDIQPVVIDAALCNDCGDCINACPVQVFERDVAGHVLAARPGDCHVCFLCVPDCPPHAITVSWDAPNKRHRSIYDVLGIDLTRLPA